MEYIEVDVKGLSCPEPVMIAMDALDEHPGQPLQIICDEAHTKANIEAMLRHNKHSYHTQQSGCEYTITVE